MSINGFDKRMFKVAREVAKTSDFKPHRLGCVIAYKHHIVSVGANSEKTSPVQKKYNKERNFTKSDDGVAIKHSLHSEISALSKISYPVGQSMDWSKVKVYIYRIAPGKKYKFGNARPCAACMAALRDCGIRHVYYTGDDSYVYERLEY